jgi:hypothetical protein
MVKLYAFLWHVSPEVIIASEGMAGNYCESAETEKPTKNEAKLALKVWIEKRQMDCNDFDCNHTTIITDKLHPKMIMGGRTANMVKVS